jgi:hypothetical protein
MYNWQKNFSRNCPLPSKLYLEKNLLEANVMQTYADLDRLSAVKVNLSFLASRHTSSLNLTMQANASWSTVTPSSLKVKLRIAISSGFIHHDLRPLIANGMYLVINLLA